MEDFDEEVVDVLNLKIQVNPLSMHDFNSIDW